MCKLRYSKAWNTLGSRCGRATAATTRDRVSRATIRNTLQQTLEATSKGGGTKESNVDTRHAPLWLTRVYKKYEYSHYAVLVQRRRYLYIFHVYYTCHCKITIIDEMISLSWWYHTRWYHSSRVFPTTPSSSKRRRYLCIFHVYYTCHYKITIFDEVISLSWWYHTRWYHSWWSITSISHYAVLVQKTTLFIHFPRISEQRQQLKRGKSSVVFKVPFSLLFVTGKYANLRICIKILLK